MYTTLLRAGLGLFCLLALYHLFGFGSPIEGVYALPDICFVRSVFDVPCPGCGMGRSFAALAEGDVLSSVRFHPLALPIFLLLGLAAVFPARGTRWLRFAAPILVLALLALGAFRLVLQG